MLFGFAAVGLRLSVVYPLVFSAAGNHPTVSAGRGRECGHDRLQRIPCLATDSRLAGRTDIAARDHEVHRSPDGGDSRTGERDAVSPDHTLTAGSVKKPVMAER
jgi:hypothetical protein